MNRPRLLSRYVLSFCCVIPVLCLMALQNEQQASGDPRSKRMGDISHELLYREMEENLGAQQTSLQLASRSSVQSTE